MTNSRWEIFLDGLVKRAMFWSPLRSYLLYKYRYAFTPAQLALAWYALAAPRFAGASKASRAAAHSATPKFAATFAKPRSRAAGRRG